MPESEDALAEALGLDDRGHSVAMAPAFQSLSLVALGLAASAAVGDVPCAAVDGDDHAGLAADLGLDFGPSQAVATANAAPAAIARRPSDRPRTIPLGVNHLSPLFQQMASRSRMATKLSDPHLPVETRLWLG